MRAGCSVDLLSYLCGRDRETDAYVNLLSVRTEAMFVNVDVHWLAVERLAEVLLRENTIGGRRAREIIQEAWRYSSKLLRPAEIVTAGNNYPMFCCRKKDVYLPCSVDVV